MPNNKNPTKACFHAEWTAFIINYGASDKTTKGLREVSTKGQETSQYETL
jgi:hypothetical protein